MNKWFIGIKERGISPYDTTDFTILESPEGHYWADPFLAEEHNTTYLFFEDYDYDKGRIACGEFKGIGKPFHPKVILDLPYHCSFPSVFKDGEDWYMTPETVMSGMLQIFKATDFPYHWAPWATVARGRYDDPVLKKVEGGYEIWTVEDGDKRRVFFSKSLDGEWGLRQAKDGQFERPAGHWFGDIQVTQDSVPEYGRAIKFKKGDNVIHTIEPTWYNNLTGTHTWNVSSLYTVIDGRIKL